MSEKTIVRKTADELGMGRTDWERVRNLTDEEIEQAIAEDPDAAPILDEEWFRTAELVVPGEKKRITMRVNQDVIDYFKRKGRGYQTRMNAVLKAYVIHQKRKEGDATSPEAA